MHSWHVPTTHSVNAFCYKIHAGLVVLLKYCTGDVEKKCSIQSPAPRPYGMRLQYMNLGTN